MLRPSLARRAAPLAVVALLAAGCGPEVVSDTRREPAPVVEVPSAPAPEAVPATGLPEPAGAAAGPARPVRVLRTVSTAVPVPWGLAELPDGTALVTSRDEHHLYRVAVPTGKVVDLGEVPGIADDGGGGGLLGVAASPDFVTDKRIYLYYSTASDNRVAHVTLRPGSPATLSAPTVVLSGIPRGTRNNGGRLVFGPDGMLYVGTGDTGVPAIAGDLDSLGGKVLRMTPEGGPAPGNPFPGSVVYSYGHRDLQGLTFDARGRLLASEVGEAFGELNWIRPGRYYGWPLTGGDADTVATTQPLVDLAGVETSPSGVALAGGTAYLAALRTQRLWRLPLDDVGLAAPPRPFLTGSVGRLRSVIALSDRLLLATTSNTDSTLDGSSADGSTGTAAPLPRAADDRLLLVAVG